MKINSLKQINVLLNRDDEQNVTITGFAVDSRLVQKGNIFFALKGEKSDGHEHLKQAFEKGASCFVVNKNFKGELFNLPVIFSDDPLTTLQLLAKKVLSSRNVKIVAITGSVGKTTTKDFLTILLKEKFFVGNTPGNANSQIGLPLTILNHTNGTEDVLVLEMGMNERKQLEKLTFIAEPDIALLTHVALTHAANFEDLKEIALEKAKIFASPKTKIGILNHDIEHLDEVLKIGSCCKVTFSVACREADFYLDHFTLISSKDASFHLDRALFPSNFGKVHVQNLMLAIIAAMHLGMTFDEIKKAINKLTLPEKRFEVTSLKGVTFINDSYNASEVSFLAALETFSQKEATGKKIVVMGEMLELGKFSKKCHENVAKKALKEVDLLFLLGKECEPAFDYWKENKKPVEWFLDRSLLAASLKDKLQKDDIVLLKGSRSNELWKILEEI